MSKRRGERASTTSARVSRTEAVTVAGAEVRTIIWLAPWVSPKAFPGRTSDGSTQVGTSRSVLMKRGSSALAPWTY